MRVIFVVIDALPNQWVGEEWTPNLWSLVQGGGWNPSGGRAVLSTATYPNHASFVTGRDPSSHGIFVNRVWDGSQFVISSKIGTQGDTLFLAADRSGVSSAVVVGDHLALKRRQYLRSFEARFVEGGLVSQKGARVF